MNVPREIFTKILLMLDGRSLHNARQVNHEWNTVIEEHVLGTVEGRRWMERTLQHQWREATPAKLEFNFGVQQSQSSQLLTFTDQFAVISSSRTWSGKSRITLVDIREGLEIMEYSSINAARVPEVLISKDILLLVWRLSGMVEVLAWNVRTKRKIFDKKLSAETVVFDHHNKQVMLGKKTRLKLREKKVITTSQATLPGSGALRVFSHPYYLTADNTLWKLSKTQLTRVGDLGAVGRRLPVFCPAREIILSYSVLPPDQINLRVFSSQSGRIIKDRQLTVPTVFHGLSSLQVNADQMVVMVRQQPGSRVVILVFQLDCLLSQCPDLDISPRILDIGQPGWQIDSFHLNKTSVSAGLDTFKISTLDFWNCLN